MLDSSERIFLNQLAQRSVGLAKGLEWFRGADPSRQLGVLRALGAMVQQAHPRENEVVVAADRFDVKQTYTPVVIFTKGKFIDQLPKALSLPENEYEKTFKILLGLLSVADERRRQTACAKGCSHWWHRDLSDPQVVESILKEGC